MKRSHFGYGLVRTSSKQYIGLVADVFSDILQIATASGIFRWEGDPDLKWWAVRSSASRKDVCCEYNVYVERAGVIDVSHWLIRDDSQLCDAKALQYMLDVAEVDLITSGVTKIAALSRKMCGNAVYGIMASEYVDTDSGYPVKDDVDPERLAREDPAEFKRIYLGIEVD